MPDNAEREAPLAWSPEWLEAVEAARAERLAAWEAEAVAAFGWNDGLPVYHFRKGSPNRKGHRTLRHNDGSAES